jgi:Na+-driven multidrug efflux pump
MAEHTAGRRSTAPASINQAIWRLSWPQMLMLLSNVFIGMVDVYVAGRIDRNVQASLGMINQALFFFLVLAGAVANGAVAAIGQSLGAGLVRRAGRYVGLSLVLGGLLGAAVAGAGFALRGPFMDLLRVPAELRDVTGYFLGVYLLLLPAYSLFTITNAVFRAYAQVLHPLYSMVLVTVANGLATFGLGLGLFGLPRFGYQGVAWGTFLAVTLGCLYNLAVFRHLGLLAASLLPPLRWSRRAMGYLLAVAWPAGLMQVLWHSGYLVLFAITASLPQDNIVALAGMTAGLRIESLIFMVGFAFNMTASILVGHYLGAGPTRPGATAPAS